MTHPFIDCEGQKEKKISHRYRIKIHKNSNKRKDKKKLIDFCCWPDFCFISTALLM